MCVHLCWVFPPLFCHPNCSALAKKSLSPPGPTEAILLLTLLNSPLPRIPMLLGGHPCTSLRALFFPAWLWGFRLIFLCLAHLHDRSGACYHHSLSQGQALGRDPDYPLLLLMLKMCPESPGARPCIYASIQPSIQKTFIKHLLWSRYHSRFKE